MSLSVASTDKSQSRGSCCCPSRASWSPGRRSRALSAAFARRRLHLIAIGQIVFIIPFSAMFAGLVVIQDRDFGILRELLVAPTGAA